MDTQRNINMAYDSQQFPESKSESFTCGICFEPTESDKRFRNGGACSHPFCTDCVAKYIGATLESGNSGRIKCPDLSCELTLYPRACESLAGPSLFVRWCDALCEEAVSGLEKCYCPARNCGALIVNECGRRGRVRKSKCPECGMWFCFECKREWHAGFDCNDFVEEERDPNDVAFGILAEAMKWMRCPRCRHFVSRVDGCRLIWCRCGASFCYNCGKQRCDCKIPPCCVVVFLVILFSIPLLVCIICYNSGGGTST